MSAKKPKPTYLRDYQAPHYWVKTIDLTFDLSPQHTQVKSKLLIEQNKQFNQLNTPLVLNGEKLKLLAISVNGHPLATTDYLVDEETLTIPVLPAQAEVEIITEINPLDNTSLSGLYMSEGLFCTQCEANGFRKITYYPDRPDVMARFTTTIRADKAQYPVLLSNGNLIKNDSVGVTWEDPYPKPAYLFALVAGNLTRIEDEFITQSGRQVAIHFFVEAENKDKCGHAIAALKRAMAWDEVHYGREYDLDIYMVVAVNDFNMGAMENKGLNVFNAKYILANPQTATDLDYELIERVIAHEYFHNWTGNRITLRDWFQLSLKEGLTVFREQHYAGDIFSKAVQRINDVNIVRTAQFAEDAGPMSHPVRPESYIEMNNFYTVTVYDKGAELIHMMRTYMGEAGFRKGMDLYFERYDGQAVTTDDFVQAMQDADGVDFTQFRRWYSQAGTPVLNITWKYDDKNHQFELTIDQGEKPLQMPIATALLDSQGNTLREEILNLTQSKQTFIFENIDQKPIPSLLRDFSAPVKINLPYSQEEWLFLLEHETDDFNRWNAAQQLATQIIFSLLPMQSYVNVIRKILTHSILNKDLIAKIIQLPSENYLAETTSIIDLNNLTQNRDKLKLNLAQALKADLLKIYHENKADNAVARSLKNVCLNLLGALDEPDIQQLCAQQYYAAKNMTDQWGALEAINHSSCSLKNELIDAFYKQWHDDPLVVNKWLGLQAGSYAKDTFQVVQQLVQHKAFELSNPNKVYSLLLKFARDNLRHFHDASGQAYEFIADYVLKLDAINPQVASRLVSSFNNWKRFDASRQNLMREQLQRIYQQENLSKDVYEIVENALK